MDHVRALNVFNAVAASASFSGAARALRMSPPSVTRIVGELEEHLGTPLFNRTTRQVALTETGVIYLEYARRIIEDLQTADDLARGDNVKPTGTLRLTASAMFGRLHVVPIIAEYVERYPDVRVEAVFVDRVVNIIEEGIDIAVRIGQLPDSSLKARKVNSIHQVVCGSPGYFEQHGIPKHPKDLSQHNIIGIGFRGESYKWDFDKGISAKVSPRISFSTIAPCLEAAKSGWGIARFLSYQIGKEVASKELQTVLSTYSTATRPIHLVHAEGRLRSAKVKTFVEMAAARLKSNEAISSNNNS
ncbi:MAG: LysR substrate-binding domain-containing protein [Litorimonas sp.]